MDTMSISSAKEGQGRMIPKVWIFVHLKINGITNGEDCFEENVIKFWVF